MAQKLKIIPLGGLNEIGKNMTVYEYGRDMILVDCGMGFPDDEMYGVDVVIPDMSWLVRNKSRLRGIFLTHGHEDHIGALPYLMDKVSAPIYATRLTAGLAELKLREHGLLETTKIVTVSPGETVGAGCFKVEFIHVNHSIADSVAFAITTPLGTVVHTGDFKIDVTPLSGEMTDLTRFGELGREGVLALLMDSTNVERAGYCPSESKVHERLDTLFKDCDKRIIVTTFASNIDRIRQVIDLAARYRRKVAITGRSMENVVQLCIELGYMKVPEGILVDMKRIHSVPDDKLVIISTGSQGESMSALYRMAFSEHKQVDVGPGDRVIISASAIPGNETMITRVIDELFAKGAEVVYERGTDLHVSGHACQEEIKMIYALTKPKFFMPVHGERRMLHKSADMICAMGHERKKVVIGENGRVVEISARTAKLGDTVPAGKVLLDGIGPGDVGSVVMRDRKHLAEEGMLVVVMTLSGEDAALISGPDLISRGFVYEKESDNLMEELRRVASESLDYCAAHNITDWASIKGKVKANLSGYLYKTTKRSPMILPVIMEV
ncbi:MAG: ribonuclease J [Oscillospiraceae bacterium]|nr:ribonuclease J [Oscillospiraceae bacterium]